jgi:hypothetical protein
MTKRELATAIFTAIIAAGSMFGFGVQPLRSENSEYAQNGQMIRDELSVCLERLEKCWKECR